MTAASIGLQDRSCLPSVRRWAAAKPAVQNHEGYRLPCKYVIHAVGPRWRDGKHGEREKLVSCYRTSLLLAKEHGCETVAFPLISSGIYGYPKDQALKVAIDTISDFLLENDMTVYIVIFDRKTYQIGEKLFSDIAAYIDDNYVDEHTDSRSERLRRMRMLSDEPEEETFGAPLAAPMAASAKTLMMHFRRSTKASPKCCFGKLTRKA